MNGCTRRQFLKGTSRIMLAGGVAWAVPACKRPSACGEGAQMSRGEADLRKSLGYTDVSDNAQTCSRCTYFKSAAGAACGTCDILSGGAVTAGGHCRSWTERGA